MKKIEGLELKELYQQASNELFEEKKTSAIKVIKKVVFKTCALKEEIDALNNKIKKKKEQLDKAIRLTDKIKEGDWSVIREDDNQQDG